MRVKAVHRRFVQSIVDVPLTPSRCTSLVVLCCVFVVHTTEWLVMEGPLALTLVTNYSSL